MGTDVPFKEYIHIRRKPQMRDESESDSAQVKLLKINMAKAFKERQKYSL